MDNLYNSTKTNLDYAINQKVELNEKIRPLNDIIQQKQQEIKIID